MYLVHCILFGVKVEAVTAGGVHAKGEDLPLMAHDGGGDIHLFPGSRGTLGEARDSARQGWPVVVGEGRFTPGGVWYIFDDLGGG